jgi:hypothetical protein
MKPTLRFKPAAFRALLAAAIAGALSGGLSGCDLLYQRGQDIELDRCDRNSGNYDDWKNCRARHRESYDDYEKRRKQDEIKLGPKKPAPSSK